MSRCMIGDNTWIPCRFCGCTYVVLDDTPECGVCSKTVEAAAVAAEKLIGALCELIDLSDKLPPTMRAVLVQDLKVASETLDILNLALEIAAAA